MLTRTTNYLCDREPRRMIGVQYIVDCKINQSQVVIGGIHIVWMSSQSPSILEKCKVSPSLYTCPLALIQTIWV